MAHRSADEGQDRCGCSIQGNVQTNKEKGETNIMSSNSNSSNKLVVPSAREAMNKFKMEAANDFDVSTSY